MMQLNQNFLKYIETIGTKCYNAFLFGKIPYDAIYMNSFVK